jgi:hypothetical protein
MALTRLKIAKKDIFHLFKSLPNRVLKRSEIDALLAENRGFWRLAEKTTGKDFIEFLMESEKLKEYRFSFPHRKEIRYVWDEATDYEIIQTLKPNSYFTHFTAVYLHQLSLQIPKTIYLNYEQTKKKSPDKGLLQERVDFAFSRACRTSNNIAEFGDMRVCILNGMYTGGLGVIDYEDSGGKSLKTTSIERTLIDITVRPIYSGGVNTVLDAFRGAHGSVSINKLAAMLSNMKYIYPYHQAIGFYLERAGVYTERQLSLIEKFEKKCDFYLAHQIKEKVYSKRWRLYHPKGL